MDHNIPGSLQKLFYDLAIFTNLKSTLITLPCNGRCKDGSTEDGSKILATYKMFFSWILKLFSNLHTWTQVSGIYTSEVETQNLYSLKHHWGKMMIFTPPNSYFFSFLFYPLFCLSFHQQYHYGRAYYEKRRHFSDFGFKTCLPHLNIK